MRFASAVVLPPILFGTGTPHHSCDRTPQLQMVSSGWSWSYNPRAGLELCGTGCSPLDADVGSCICSIAWWNIRGEVRDSGLSSWAVAGSIQNSMGRGDRSLDLMFHLGLSDGLVEHHQHTVVSYNRDPLTA